MLAATRRPSTNAPSCIPSCLAGIFVGGHSSRMRGLPKGLLQPPGQSLTVVQRLINGLNAVGIRDVVLVGKHPAYASIPLPVVDDAAVGEGPIAGLLGLVTRAERAQFEFVLAIACDMPTVTLELLSRLLRERHDAAALVPRSMQFEPLCARYRVKSVLPHLIRMANAGQYRLMHLLDVLKGGCVPLHVEPGEYGTLLDWDSPSDLPAGVTYEGQLVDAILPK